MQLQQAIDLIEHAPFDKSTQRWADLGCGEGLFSEALAHQLPKDSIIYSIDKTDNFNSFKVEGIDTKFIQADFIRDELRLEKLDGILMANAIHYVKDKIEFLEKVEPLFIDKPKFVIVEYDTDKPVPVWVPYPISFISLIQLFEGIGYRTVEKLAEHPSVYGRGNMYSAWVSR